MLDSSSRYTIILISHIQMIIFRSFQKRKIFSSKLPSVCVEASGSEDWMGKTLSDPLEGFHWCGGSQRDTTGILIWSKVFIVRTTMGKEVAVILMDTQVKTNS